VDVKRNSDTAWAAHNYYTTLVTVKALRPGTKYQFKARAGIQDPEGVRWGEESVESSYATSGIRCAGCTGICSSWSRPHARDSAFEEMSRVFSKLSTQ
jgi:hypothetical protein